MKNFILLILLTAGCTQQKTDVTGYYQGYQRGWKDANEILSAFRKQTGEKLECDQAALDKHSAEIGAYEITCDELEAL
jgi:hypothetical protein